MSPRRFPTLLASVLFLATLVAPAFAAAPDELIWRGDHATGRAIMEDLSKQYAKEKKGKITLQPFSTLSGLDAVASGSADIAGSARGKYARRIEEANVDFVPAALDAAVMITHPRNPASNLTLRQIHDIYYGRITNWKELGGNDTPINLYAIAAPLDGVEFSLRELVFRNGDQRIAAPRLYLNTTKLEEAIALDPAGLGLSTLANVSANKGVKMLSVEAVAPSTTTVADASYPLFITLYVANRADSPKREAIDRFVAFLDTPPAKDILRKHQLVPYADAGGAIAHSSDRMAFIDAHVGRDAAANAAATLAAATPVPTPTPVSAPRASLEAKARIAPTAESTQAARENLARAEEKKAAKLAASAPTAQAVAATSSAEEAPKKAAVVAAAPHKAAASPVKAAIAAAAPANAADAPAVAKSTPAKPAAKKAKAVAKAPAPAKPAAPASFGNVSGGATGS
jgi:phosphate transport system substrate-binding protein